MTLFDRVLHPLAQRNRRSLRRVSPERVKAGARASRRPRPASSPTTRIIVRALSSFGNGQPSGA